MDSSFLFDNGFSVQWYGKEYIFLYYIEGLDFKVLDFDVV